MRTSIPIHGRSFFFSLGTLILFLNLNARALDGGIDPANLGKGDHIYFLSQATNKLGGHVPSVINIPTLMTYYQSQGIQFIVVKAGTGSTNFPSNSNIQFTSNLVFQAHQKGIKIFGYTRSYGDNIQGEINLATSCFNKGADGFMLDAEIEWEAGHQGTQGPAKAIQLCSGIKNLWPNKFLCHAPAMYISVHNSFPLKEFNRYCDAVMPQAYWVSFGITPSQVVADLDAEWSAWQNTLTGSDTNSIKPIAPIGQADTTSMPGSQITTFVNSLKNDANPATFAGYKGVSFWRADLHTVDQWNNGIGPATIGSTVAPVFSGVVAASITDHSATIAWRTDIYGDSIVDYGLTTAYGSSKTNSTMVWIHSVNLTSLSASTTYHFRVKSKNVAGQQRISGDFTFTTLPAGVVNDITIDNPDATTVGSWNIGTTSPDKFDVDYRYNSQGNGSAYLQYTPNILVPGNYNLYEWHPQGGNRSVGTPHIITYNGGSVTLNINQQINGGTWNLLGTFNFVTGTAGNVKITDGFADAGQLAMADAIRLSFVAPPLAPSGLTATAVSSSQINLSWIDNSLNENNFVVSRSTTSGGPYTDIATLAANTTSFNNTGLSPGTTYYYVVRAVNSMGSSPFSNQASATTQQIPPVAPSGLTATAVSSSQINLSWTDNSSNESNFIVGRSTTSGGPYTDIATLAANTTSFNNTALTPNTTYFYVVRASNASGSSANSAQASATTLQAPPAAPSGLTATAVSQTQINLSWTDNSSDESNFIVGRSTTSGGPYTDIATLAANTTSYNNIGLSAGTTYYYVVRASNAGGSSANSAQASATTIPNPPAAPSGLTATAVSTSQINLSWIDNSSNESNFIVGRSTTSGGPYTDIATLAANTTSFNNTGLAANTTYFYVVRASNAGGSSANSAQASATTVPSAPAAPGGLTATAISASQINLAWTDNSPNEDNFIVARSTVSGGPYTDIATLPANTTSYNNTGLAASTTYYYVVRAVNAGGASPNSNQASATTQASGGVPDIIVDNPAATVVGSWFTATSAPDRFGADYRYKSQGTGAAYLQFTPTVTTNGVYQVYEWHSQGANRTVGGPHVITYNGGTATVNVNQQLNGGTWNLIGTFSFLAGTSGNVKITDAFADAGQIAITDAIKFVYVAVPLAPAAPSGLTASPASGSSITLSWTDNATTEANYIVARSTTSGGPYTDIATLAANTASYTDSGLTKGTTYYYVVRATNAGGSSANSNQASAVIPADIIIDNPSATVVGTWSTGTSSLDKFGTDYRFKGPGTGTAYLQYTPSIATAGQYQVYEWHPQGSNRTTAAQHVITFNGGSQTVLVNQQVGGGTWNLIGTFNFAAGTAGNIKINDNYSVGSVVIADAVKLVFVSP